MMPNGPTRSRAFTRGFFKVAEAQKPKPQTIAIAMADAEFGRNACEGARAECTRRQASRSSTKRPIRRPRPISRRSCARCRRSIRTCLVICSYPLDTVGMVQGDERVGFKPKMWGGAMVGLQSDRVQDPARPAAQRRRQFRNLAAGQDDGFPRRRGPAEEISGARRGRRASIRSAITCRRGPMPICRCSATRSKAPRASTTTKLADYIRKTTFKTVVGDVKFGKQGRMGGGAHAGGPVPEHQGQDASTISAT